MNTDDWREDLGEAKARGLDSLDISTTIAGALADLVDAVRVTDPSMLAAYLAATEQPILAEKQRAVAEALRKVDEA